jgi:uncharacterized protein
MQMVALGGLAPGNSRPAQVMHACLRGIARLHHRARFCRLRAVAAFQQVDYQTALRELQPPAEAGDPRAEYAIALIYRDALGVKRDKAAAWDWLRRSAEHGWPFAMFDLGEMYA